MHFTKVNIEELKPQIIERLKPLALDKIILFGSYAYGTPTENSDIDLFLIKKIEKEKVRDLIVDAHLRVRDLISKYKIGFDFIVADENFLKNREDYFYKKEVLEQGKVIYE